MGLLSNSCSEPFFLTSINGNRGYSETVEAIIANDDNRLSATQEPIRLPFEDRNRMTRLYEEVVARLEEMAMITARTLRMDASEGFSVKFRPLSEGDEAEFTAAEIVSTPRGCACYDYREGACYRTTTR
jgi:hypothetical protein